MVDVALFALFKRAGHTAANVQRISFLPTVNARLALL